MRRGFGQVRPAPQSCRVAAGHGDAELIEDSRTEPCWGIGPDGLGLNWAGRVIREVRDKLRQQ